MVTRVTASPNTAESAAAVTPNDVTNQAVPFRALWIGGTGDVVVVFYDDTTATFKNVPVGMFPVGGKRVNATNTTATLITAVY